MGLPKSLTIDCAEQLRTNPSVPGQRKPAIPAKVRIRTVVIDVRSEPLERDTLIVHTLQKSAKVCPQAKCARACRSRTPAW